MHERTIKCPICGKPYVVYSMTTRDQSACRECVDEARKAVKRESTPEERERRSKYYGNFGA